MMTKTKWLGIILATFPKFVDLFWEIVNNPVTRMLAFQRYESLKSTVAVLFSEENTYYQKVFGISEKIPLKILRGTAQTELNEFKFLHVTLNYIKVLEEQLELPEDARFSFHPLEEKSGAPEWCAGAYYLRKMAAMANDERRECPQSAMREDYAENPYDPATGDDTFQCSSTFLKQVYGSENSENFKMYGRDDVCILPPEEVFTNFPKVWLLDSKARLFGFHKYWGDYNEFFPEFKTRVLYDVRKLTPIRYRQEHFIDPRPRRGDWETRHSELVRYPGILIDYILWMLYHPDNEVREGMFLFDDKKMPYTRPSYLKDDNGDTYMVMYTYHAIDPSKRERVPLMLIKYSNICHMFHDHRYQAKWVGVQLTGAKARTIKEIFS
jgi:hypothetical protein